MDISPEHLALIKDILTKHLNKDARVWLFGSRSRGLPKPYSDCDLVY